MNARFVTLVLLLFVWLEGDSVWAQYLPKLYQVFSPDKKLKMAIQRHNDGLLTYTFAANREILIKESPLGFKLESQETVPSSGWKIEKVSDRKVRDEWKPLWGKRAVVEDHFNELVIDLVNPAGQLERMQLVVRGYNDGFAFCYKIPDGKGLCVNVQSELTAYNFAGDYTAWFYNGENHNIGPEKLTETDGTRLPVMTVKAGDKHYMAIHEACLETGAPLVLQSKGGESLFSVASKPTSLPGGMLTNFPTIRKAVKKMTTIDKMEKDGTFAHLSKREKLQISRQRAKLEKNLGSIADLTRLPAALFVVDVMKEYIAVKEANTLGIPVFAIVDTNSNPEGIDFVIPANDDASTSISLIIDKVAGAIKEGLTERKAEREKEGDKKGAEKAEAQDEVAEVSETASEE